MPYGSGSLRERSPGVWQLRVYGGRDLLTGKHRDEATGPRDPAIPDCNDVRFCLNPDDPDHADERPEYRGPPSHWLAGVPVYPRRQ